MINKRKGNSVCKLMNTRIMRKSMVFVKTLWQTSQWPQRYNSVFYLTLHNAEILILSICWLSWQKLPHCSTLHLECLLPNTKSHTKITNRSKHTKPNERFQSEQHLYGNHCYLREYWNLMALITANNKASLQTIAVLLFQCTQLWTHYTMLIWKSGRF